MPDLPVSYLCTLFHLCDLRGESFIKAFDQGRLLLDLPLLFVFLILVSRAFSFEELRLFACTFYLVLKHS